MFTSIQLISVLKYEVYYKDYRFSALPIKFKILSLRIEVSQALVYLNLRPVSHQNISGLARDQ